ncbi:MAG: 4-hydroxythreonine-4-phosphate dehydrogenase PdxA [Hyphomicrobiaceae bacterium]
MTNRSILAITMGDPAGIGPEITLKAVSTVDLAVAPVLLGDYDLLKRTASELRIDIELCRVPSVPTPHERANPSSWSNDPWSNGHGLATRSAVPVLQIGDPLPPIENGRVSGVCGQAAFEYIRAGIELAKSGSVDALVTAPIHKEALAAGGIPYPGHTEMLAELGGPGGVDRVAMMLVNDELRVVLVTIHCSLREAVDKIDLEAEHAAIRLAEAGARQLGIAQPRIAVAGLNPHAGEGGLFGREEIDVIAPAIVAARREGIDVSGPWSGDTVFMQARNGKFDVVVAQYHDQGLIPIKYLGLDRGVNITLGLPFIRTSPDHGTAFDIAGTGVADPASMRCAIEYAQRVLHLRESDGPVQSRAI